MVSDNCFRLVTAEVSSTGTPSTPSAERSPRSSGGRSAASVSQVRVDAVDGKMRVVRCGTATICHSSPLAACTVMTCTRSLRHGDIGGCQTVLDDRGGVEVGQESRHRRIRSFGVSGGYIRERIEMLGAGPAVSSADRAALASTSTPSIRRTSATRSGSG